MAFPDFTPDDSNYEQDDLPAATRAAWETHLSKVLQPQIEAFKEAYKCQLPNPSRLHDIASEFQWDTEDFSDDFHSDIPSAADADPELFTFFDSPAYIVSVGLFDLGEQFLLEFCQNRELSSEVVQLALQLAFNLGRLRAVHTEMLANAEYHEGALVQCQVIRSHPLWNTTFHHWLLLGKHAPKTPALSKLSCVLHDYRESLLLLKQTADQMGNSLDE
jgi:hypothetical protein